jgi:hypothetical protein
MAMKILAFHYQLVADLATDNEHDNFVSLDIVQGTQVSCSQFELCQRIGTKALDCLRRCHGLVLKAGEDGRLQNALVPHGQRSKLTVRILSNGNSEGHSDPDHLKPASPT